MSYQLNVKKLIQELRGPKGVEILKDEFNKIKSEVQKINKMIKPQAQASIKQAEDKYHNLVKTLSSAQGEFDKEMKKTVTLIKKSAIHIEKNLNNYKKVALQQKAKLSKVVSSKKNTVKKAATTTKKATKKVARRASKTTRKQA